MSQVKLLARGRQDVWLSGRPEVSFFRSNYKSHKPFGISTECFTVPVNGNIVLNTKSDLIGYTYLTAHDSSGTLLSTIDWSTVLSSIDLVIGNQLIASHDLTYINLIQKVLEADNYSKRSTTPGFQPLGFFFDKQPLPIIALKYTDVKIIINWASDIVARQYVYKCWVQCFHLSDEERKYFAESRHHMLIPQLQRVKISNEPNLHGPIKYIAAPCVNYSSVYSPSLPGIAQWATSIAGLGIDIGQSITSDSSGNIYVTGYYGSNPITIYNNGEGTFGTLTNSGGNDVFIVKYNTNGTAQWAARLAGTGNDQGNSITSDSSGNIYVTGFYGTNPITIYNSDGNSSGITLTNSGNNDVFIVKYDTNGTAQWATRIAGLGSESGSSITADSSGNIYVTGNYLTFPITIYNNGGGTFGALANSGSTDVFIVKYNTNGTAQWATRLAGSANDIGYSIISDSSRNIYVTGSFATNPLTIYNNGGGTFGTLANSGSTDVFIVKYNTNGFAQWATRLGGTGAEVGQTITTDSSGNIYVTGYYASNPLTVYNSDGNSSGITLTNSGSNDVFIVKYDTNGFAQWATRLGGTGGDIGQSITSDSSGNIYVTGYYASNPLTIYNSDGNSSGLTLTNSGSNDVFIVKYNTNGFAQWATRLGGTGADQGNSITSDSSGNIYVTGTYLSNPLTIYNNGGGTFGTLKIYGSNDVFIVKFKA